MMLMNNAEPAPQLESRRLPSPDRAHTVTPLDVRQAKFATTMRGYDKAEVNAFLLEAADGYETATRENERLRHELARLEASLHQYRELEGTLKSALISAQKLADDVRESAMQESERLRETASQEAIRTRENAAEDAARIVGDASRRADMLMEQTQARVEDVQREIDGLKLKRREAESGLESIISALHNTLDFVREQDEREQRVVLHRPRVEIAQSA